MTNIRHKMELQTRNSRQLPQYTKSNIYVLLNIRLVDTSEISISVDKWVKTCATVLSWKWGIKIKTRLGCAYAACAMTQLVMISFPPVLSEGYG